MLLNQLSAVLAGFSVVGAIILLFAYLFFLPEMRKSVASKLSCVAMLLGLAGLQLYHFSYFLQPSEVLALRSYCVLLMLLPASFFFFAREVLFAETRYRTLDLLHALPLIISFALPVEVIPGLAFLLGTAYTVLFARVIYKLRDQRGRFKFEMFFFGLFALMAIAALILGLALPIMDPQIYFITYSNSISLAMVLIVTALLIFPELLSDILLIAELAYAKSKLVGINTEEKIAELERMMVQEKHYENEQINLASVAELLGISSHQLSELINTEYGFSFPRFVREHRVRAAKSLLLVEPNTSVLAISMMIGFKSQSNFYTAFKESTGKSPGNYRAAKVC